MHVQALKAIKEKSIRNMPLDQEAMKALKDLLATDGGYQSMLKGIEGKWRNIDSDLRG